MGRKNWLVALFLTATLGSERAMAMGKGWFSGPIEAAFTAARTADKPLLVYWGAQWCPPCNELKSQVFSQPGFAELIAPLIAVALDGDSEQAQAWGDKLHVTGYPTVLLLDAKGQELTRLPTTGTLREFAAALHAALATGGPLKAAFARVGNGQASDDDWRMLAYANWDEKPDLGLAGAELLAAQVQLAHSVPPRLGAEQALLTAQMLSACASADSDDKLKAAVTAHCPADAAALFQALLTSTERRQATRTILVYNGPALLGWLYPHTGLEQSAADKAWLAAMAAVAQDPLASPDMRLWSGCAPFQIFRLRHEQAALPPELRLIVTKQAAAAVQAAKTAYDRHAVISGAAWLLREVGDSDGARKLLNAELATTDTPWYYQSALSDLELAEGHEQQALAWSQQARLSVRGRASRLQWIVDDVLLTVKVNQPNQEQRLKDVLREYYTGALSFNDGFQGRNATRAARVATALQPWLMHPEIKDLLQSYRAACPRSPAAPACEQHFTALLK